ncbi:MAG: 4-oxalomesaconate tautomerase, partial [Shimia sp.]|nr:4-oxalomesaconate tautomerase [Shimia sp.]
TPKFAILAPAQIGGTVATRYFMPWKTHRSMAVTGAQCIASCALTPGSVADGLLQRPTTSPTEVVLEHVSGTIDVLVDFSTNGGFDLNAAGLVRTARKIADGQVYVPSEVWNGEHDA